MSYTPLPPRDGLFRALALLSCAAFASSASVRLCDPFLPQLVQDFSITQGQAAHVISFFSVTYGLMQLVYGPLADRLGKYRLVAWATAACVLGTALSALSSSFGMLLMARVLTGGCAAALIPLSMAWIGDSVPYEQRQSTIARFLFGQIMGLVSGQVLGGFFADTIGWRAGFASLAGVYALIGILLFRELKHNPLTHNPAPAQGQAQGAMLTSMVSQLLTVAKTPWARVILFTVCLEGVCLFGSMAFVPSFLHQRFGLSLTHAGAVTAVFGVGGLLYVLNAKRWVRTLGEMGLATAGGLCSLAAFGLLSFMQGWIWGLPAALLLGLGFYMFHNTLQTHATQMVPHLRGTAVAAFASVFFLGQSLGVSMASVWVDRHAMEPMFMASGVALFGLGVAFFFKLRHRAHHRTVA